MARKPRSEFTAGLYHVFARGIDKQLIFRDEVDCRMYLTLLKTVVEETEWRCLAYCLMRNHVHLVLETIGPNLGRGMQLLHGRYGAAFNARHGRIGPVFQGRFGANQIESDAQFVAALGYVARNPVEAELCQRPEEWPWNSYRAIVAGAAPTWIDVDGLLGRLASSGGEPMTTYRAIVMGTEGTVPVGVIAG